MKYVFLLSFSDIISFSLLISNLQSMLYSFPLFIHAPEMVLAHSLLKNIKDFTYLMK